LFDTTCTDLIVSSFADLKKMFRYGVGLFDRFRVELKNLKS